jgi:hypothetical protein
VVFEQLQLRAEAELTVDIKASFTSDSKKEKFKALSIKAWESGQTLD